MTFGEHSLKRHKETPIKSHHDSFKSNLLAIQGRQNRKVWSVAECERIISNCTNPVGKVSNFMNNTLNLRKFAHHKVPKRMSSMIFFRRSRESYGSFHS